MPTCRMCGNLITTGDQAAVNTDAPTLDEYWLCKNCYAGEMATQAAQMPQGANDAVRLNWAMWARVTGWPQLQHNLQTA
ncbi:MAG TPA: hypothetical protein VGS80_05295 [Ktedonobacterales bacterium]|jgi:hypothetical protein|nr:hypothetical protein [Ktedonobacterales bacterium]